MTQRTPSDPKLMEDLLLGQIIEDAEQSRQIGCDPSVFLEMVQSHEPVEACKRMIESPVLGQGLLRLKQVWSTGSNGGGVGSTGQV